MYAFQTAPGGFHSLKQINISKIELSSHIQEI